MGRLSPKELWAAVPQEEKQLKQYTFTDNGPTVLLMLDLNSHLGLEGTQGSDAVESLQQFRVICEKDSIDIQLRLQHPVTGKICHFQLWLHPLAKNIVPEDTVPKLRGKESKRRLELMLFKEDKQDKWFGNLVSEAKARRESSNASAKGSLLNPLSAEELARLPTPAGAAGS